MRKMSTVFACVAVLAMVTVASAGNINLAFVSTCPNGGPPGALPAFNATLGNPTIWLAPTDQNATLATRYGVSAAALAYDTNALHILMDVQCRADGVGNEIVSSLGLNVHKVATGGPDTGALSATGFTVFTAGATTSNSAQTPWSSPSPNTPTLNAAGGLLVQNSRAVAVPSSTTDGLWAGYTPNRDSAGGETNTGCGAGGRYAGLGAGGHYRAARLNLSSGTTGNTVAHLPTSFNVFMQVGALKITRVYDPTAGNGGAPENVSFGTGGDATVSGSTPGAESTIADAVVVIRRKGDFGSADANGNSIPVPDGQVGSDDTSFFLAAFGTTDPLKQYLGDFGSADANGNSIPVRDCQVGSDDTTFFLRAFGS